MKSLFYYITLSLLFFQNSPALSEENHKFEDTVRRFSRIDIFYLSIGYPDYLVSDKDFQEIYSKSPFNFKELLRFLADSEKSQKQKLISILLFQCKPVQEYIENIDAVRKIYDENLIDEYLFLQYISPHFEFGGLYEKINDENVIFKLKELKIIEYENINIRRKIDSILSGYYLDIIGSIRDTGQPIPFTGCQKQ